MYFIITAAERSSRSKKLKHDVIEAINELIQDIETCHEQISEQAVGLIHQKYVLYIMMYLVSLHYAFVDFVYFIVSKSIVHHQ